MGIHMKPHGVRTGWAKGVAAGDELADARTYVPTARGSNLGDFDSYLSGVATEIDGVLEVGELVIDELDEGVESCITTYANTEGKTSGGFNDLARP